LILGNSNVWLTKAMSDRVLILALRSHPRLRLKVRSGC
jgi:hypothetical protein